MSREHPILFSAPMVRALLARRKTQTRRLDHRWLGVRAGDLLWVRETWRTWKSLDNKSPAQIAAMCKEAGWSKPWSKIEYIADGWICNGDVYDDGDTMGKTRSPLHLPRWACRLMLRATADAHLERLQDISEEDARAEGVPTLDLSADPQVQAAIDRGPFGTRDSFADVWERLHGTGSWAANPEVVVLAFEVVTP